MSLAFYICAGISVLLLIFELAQIVAALGNIRETLDIIHRDLCGIQALSNIRETLDTLVPKVNKNKPGKQREYWRDQNGFRHWRKKKDA